MTHNIPPTQNQFNSFKPLTNDLGYTYGQVVGPQSKPHSASFVSNPFDSSFTVDNYTLKPLPYTPENKLMQVLVQTIALLTSVIRLVLQRIGLQQNPAVNGSLSPNGTTPAAAGTQSVDASAASGSSQAPQGSSPLVAENNPSPASAPQNTTASDVDATASSQKEKEAKEAKDKHAVKDAEGTANNQVINKVLESVHKIFDRISSFLSSERLSETASKISGWIEKGLTIFERVASSLSKVGEALTTVASLVFKGPKLFRRLFKAFRGIFKKGKLPFKGMFKKAKKFFKKIF